MFAILYIFSFLCVHYIAENKLLNGFRGVPRDLYTYVAKLKPESMGISTDKLASEKECYMSGWECGT